MKINNSLKNIIICFEDINFDELECYTYKKDRQIFFHKSKDLVYKTFSIDWEFANNVELAIDKGYYDNNLAPNFFGLIKSKDGRNRGYVCKKFKQEQIMRNLMNSPLSLRKKLSILWSKKSIQKILKPKYFRNNLYLNNFLYVIFSRSLKTEIMFNAIGPSSIWISKVGYHLLDLESIRTFDWLFTVDKSDKEYIRKVTNKKLFNNHLKEIIEYHKLIYPLEIYFPDDIPIFWKSYIEANQINGFPLELK